MKVIAVQTGFDNLTLREPGGEPFEMPDDSFEPREKLDDQGRPTGRYYDLPEWFVPYDQNERDRVEQTRKRLAKDNRKPFVSAVNPQTQQAEAETERKRLAAEQEAERQRKIAEERDAAIAKARKEEQQDHRKK